MLRTSYRAREPVALQTSLPTWSQMRLSEQLLADSPQGSMRRVD